jgi:hypothetical protein
MKRYAPKRIQPNSNQFYSFTQDKLSEQGKQSSAGLVVRHLFQAAQDLYNSLAFHTSEQLSVFIDAGRYLTPAQEHDLVALTANYVVTLNSFEIREIVNRDQSISEEDRSVLKLALGLYDNTARATSIALGNPQWIE